MIRFESLGSMPRILVLVAMGFGIYVAGITAVGTREADRGAGGGSRRMLYVGSMLVLIGVFVLAVSPMVVGNPMWRLNTQTIFPLVIALVSFPVIRKCFAAASSPSPSTVQAAVRGGVLNIIPLAACYAVLGAGIWGVGVFALAAPSLYLSFRYRVT